MGVKKICVMQRLSNSEHFQARSTPRNPPAWGAQSLEVARPKRSRWFPSGQPPFLLAAAGGDGDAAVVVAVSIPQFPFLPPGPRIVVLSCAVGWRGRRAATGRQVEGRGEVVTAITAAFLERGTVAHVPQRDQAILVRGEMGKYFPMRIARLPHAHVLDLCLSPYLMLAVKRCSILPDEKSCQ